ncbi:MAG: MaoC family dehydratase N-terminal domain-containing protein [Rhizobiaceae bacterium]
MSILTDEIRFYVGKQSERVFACDPVEKGAVRRFAQAIMDEQPKYGAEGIDEGGQSLAPPLFPPFMFRRPLGTEDPISKRAEDPDFDGLTLSVNTGLPDLPLPGLALLNGGAEIEFYRHARHGEWVSQRSRYSDIYERESKKGPMLFVVTETDYETRGGDLLVRVRQVNIRR